MIEADILLKLMPIQNIVVDRFNLIAYKANQGAALA